ncbi:DUF4376 domain-containing protein [Agrobacterium sp. ST15.13.015]|uniref:DUF4376 domain-containing protein n=1 Tax=Agrobacterium sp. ST15.13.015 TaxID=3017319 RepID=UPI0022C71EB7|nr:DUF4376 domain-containing protein [Agrobacterium sp. ST15.13.015]MCZ7501274.1 DUF4376 domain-containing protein [Rhizobium rhizogenes]
MSKLARCENGVVAEVVELPDDVKVEDAFHPDLAVQFVECGNDVVPGWLYDGKKFKAPSIHAATQDELRAYSAVKRFAAETGGIVVNRVQIDTSRDSQNMIANAHSYIVNSGAASSRFKSRSGWIVLSADEVKNIALAVGAHVQSCFDREAEVDQLITAETINDFAMVDAAYNNRQET